MKVYGPYKRKDNREHVIIIDGSERKTVSYPKYLLQQSGVNIPKGYDIPHKNEDPTDNRLENLEIIEHSKHVSEHQTPAEMYKFTCPECGKRAEIPLSRFRGNAKQNKAGPFCGRSCAGKYSKKI